MTTLRSPRSIRAAAAPRSARLSLSLSLALCAVAAVPARAAAAFNVVTTTQGLAALSQEVGGDHVHVESLSRGVQDPHFVDANPMLAVKLRNAGLLVDVGLDLEIGWLPPLVNQSRNPDIQPGGARRLTAASAVTVLDVPTGPVSRAQGDLHPGGNPHFLSDPRRAAKVAQAIAAKLSQLDPGNAPAYAQRLQDFLKRLSAAQAGWEAQLAPARGKKIFTKHRTMTYFLDWSGIVDDGEVEPRPGVTPPPSHLADLVAIAQRDGVKAITVEDYYDPQTSQVVARHSGAKVVMIPGDVGGEPGVDTYTKYMDVMVGRIAGALK